MNLLEEYISLCQVPENAEKSWYQQRGYKFEKLIYNVMNRDGLVPRASYKIQGEQIDGSFILGDRVYLLEAKWHKKEMAASDIYEFKGKVDGKLVGTIGVFISISGFSNDSVNALIYGKEINVILFDQKDFEMSLKTEGAFKKILLEKIRVAAEEGSPFCPTEIVFDTEELPVEKNDSDGTVENDAPNEFVIICEGNTDRVVLETVTRRMTEKSIEFIVANGVRNIPLLANRLLQHSRNRKIILVADSDGNEKRVHEMFEKNVLFDGWNAVIINDCIEDWLNIDKREHRKKTRTYIEAAQNVNFDELREKSKSFELFYNLISE